MRMALNHGLPQSVAGHSEHLRVLVDEPLNPKGDECPQRKLLWKGLGYGRLSNSSGWFGRKSRQLGLVYVICLLDPGSLARPGGGYTRVSILSIFTSDIAAALDNRRL